VKCGVAERRSQLGEVGIVQPGFQAVEACTELVVDRISGSVEHRGCLRVSGATGDQCQAELRVGDQ
jgi:hypothetical protein